MPELIATRAYRYGGRALQPGDPFEASSRDARLLKAIRKAKAAPEVVASDEEPSGDEAAQVSRGRGRYQRRDMRAED